MEPHWVGELARSIDHAIWTGQARPMNLPWEPVPGGPCPYCWAQGYDDGGPGSWSCKECNRSGTVPEGFVAPRPYVVETTEDSARYRSRLRQREGQTYWTTEPEEDTWNR